MPLSDDVPPLRLSDDVPPLPLGKGVLPVPVWQTAFGSASLPFVWGDTAPSFTPGSIHLSQNSLQLLEADGSSLGLPAAAPPVAIGLPAAAPVAIGLPMSVGTWKAVDKMAVISRCLAKPDDDPVLDVADLTSTQRVAHVTQSMAFCPIAGLHLRPPNGILPPGHGMVTALACVHMASGRTGVSRPIYGLLQATAPSGWEPTTATPTEGHAAIVRLEKAVLYAGNFSAALDKVALRFSNKHGMMVMQATKDSTTTYVPVGTVYHALEGVSFSAEPASIARALKNNVSIHTVYQEGTRGHQRASKRHTVSIMGVGDCTLVPDGDTTLVLSHMFVALPVDNVNQEACLPPGGCSACTKAGRPSDARLPCACGKHLLCAHHMDDGTACHLPAAATPVKSFVTESIPGLATEGVASLGGTTAHLLRLEGLEGRATVRSVVVDLPPGITKGSVDHAHTMAAFLEEGVSLALVVCEDGDAYCVASVVTKANTTTSTLTFILDAWSMPTAHSTALSVNGKIEFGADDLAMVNTGVLDPIDLGCFRGGAVSVLVLPYSATIPGINVDRLQRPSILAADSRVNTETGATTFTRPAKATAVRYVAPGAGSTQAPRSRKKTITVLFMRFLAAQTSMFISAAMKAHMSKFRDVSKGKVCLAMSQRDSFFTDVSPSEQAAFFAAFTKGVDPARLEKVTYRRLVTVLTCFGSVPWDGKGQPMSRSFWTSSRIKKCNQGAVYVAASYLLDLGPTSPLWAHLMTMLPTYKADVNKKGVAKDAPWKHPALYLPMVADYNKGNHPHLFVLTKDQSTTEKLPNLAASMACYASNTGYNACTALDDVFDRVPGPNGVPTRLQVKPLSAEEATELKDAEAMVAAAEAATAAEAEAVGAGAGAAPPPPPSTKVILANTATGVPVRLRFTTARVADAMVFAADMWEFSASDLNSCHLATGQVSDEGLKAMFPVPGSRVQPMSALAIAAVDACFTHCLPDLEGNVLPPRVEVVALATRWDAAKPDAGCTPDALQALADRAVDLHRFRTGFAVLPANQDSAPRVYVSAPITLTKTKKKAKAATGARTRMQVDANVKLRHANPMEFMSIATSQAPSQEAHTKDANKAQRRNMAAHLSPAKDAAMVGVYALLHSSCGANLGISPLSAAARCMRYPTAVFQANFAAGVAITQTQASPAPKAPASSRQAQKAALEAARRLRRQETAAAVSLTSLALEAPQRAAAAVQMSVPEAARPRMPPPPPPSLMPVSGQMPTFCVAGSTATESFAIGADDVVVDEEAKDGHGHAKRARFHEPAAGGGLSFLGGAGAGGAPTPGVLTFDAMVSMFGQSYIQISFLCSTMVQTALEASGGKTAEGVALALACLAGAVVVDNSHKTAFEFDPDRMQALAVALPFTLPPWAVEHLADFLAVVREDHRRPLVQARDALVCAESVHMGVAEAKATLTEAKKRCLLLDEGDDGFPVLNAIRQGSYQTALRSAVAITTTPTGHSVALNETAFM